MSFAQMNALAKKRTPFLFITDFKAQNIQVFTLDTLKENDIEFCINKDYKVKKHQHFLQSKPIDFQTYKKKFDIIIQKIQAGETYILNLTAQTPIQTELGLKEMYRVANARYKLRFKDKFICFSPETFIEITENSIHTYPMKGTIDSSIQNAQAKILANEKEIAEHIMIVDLLRNDLSIVATDVRVEAFREVLTLNAGDKELLQISSHISGQLDERWHEKVGTILQSLLPAGSISGAPKKSTVSIIEAIEEYNRGYFSGVFGIYDGKTLQSGVMIRFIEKIDKGFIYKSGGGITLDSDVKSEYAELQDKIYLP